MMTPLRSCWTTRFKTTCIKEDRFDFIKSRAVAEIESIVSAREKAKAPPAISTTPPVAAAAGDIPPQKKVKKTLSSYFKKVAPAGQGSSSSQPTRESIEVELTMYLHTAESDLDINCLEWWRQHEVNFPLVAMLAKKIPVHPRD